MRLRAILVESTKSSVSHLYHRTNSFHSVNNILSSGHLCSIVSDFDLAIGHKRLSTAISLEASKRDWEFGPYIIEIHLLQHQPLDPLDTEFILRADSQFEFTRWGIDISPMGQSESDILWFSVHDISDFDHERFDKLVLDSFVKGARELGYSWEKDFYNGHWPALQDHKLQDEYQYDLDEYHSLSPDQRKEWGVQYRKGLY